MNAGQNRRRASRGRVILVLGGAASGKSAFALKLAERGARRTRGPQAFVATGQPLDAEMAEKIRRHRLSRGAEWETAEVPVELADWFESKAARYRTIVLDCLTLWLTNLQGRGVKEGQIPGLVAALLQAIRRSRARVVIVTNELGMGLVPCDARSRRFRELAGRVNQQVAAEADEVYLVVGGLPVRLKA